MGKVLGDGRREETLPQKGSDGVAGSACNCITDRERDTPNFSGYKRDGGTFVFSGSALQIK